MCYTIYWCALWNAQNFHIFALLFLLQIIWVVGTAWGQHKHQSGRKGNRIVGSVFVDGNLCNLMKNVRHVRGFEVLLGKTRNSIRKCRNIKLYPSWCSSHLSKSINVQGFAAFFLAVIMFIVQCLYRNTKNIA